MNALYSSLITCEKSDTEIKKKKKIDKKYYINITIRRRNTYYVTKRIWDFFLVVLNNVLEARVPAEGGWGARKPKKLINRKHILLFNTILMVERGDAVRRDVRSKDIGAHQYSRGGVRKKKKKNAISSVVRRRTVSGLCTATAAVDPVTDNFTESPEIIIELFANRRDGAHGGPCRAIGGVPKINDSSYLNNHIETLLRVTFIFLFLRNLY